MLHDVQLSDLFFNHEHENYDRLHSSARAADVHPSPEEVETAIKADADDFAEQFPEFGKSGEWYAADFLKRL